MPTVHVHVKEQSYPKTGNLKNDKNMKLTLKTCLFYDSRYVSNQELFV